MKLSIVLWIAAAGIFVCHGMIDEEPMSASDLIQIANEKLNRTTDELAAPPLAVIPGVSHAVISSDRFDSRWPNAVVYYKIASSFTESMKKTILDSMAAISSVSCVRFLEADPSIAAYVDILRTVNGQDKGCYSFLGKIGRRQDLSLGSNCVHESVVVHELLHALGFYHEQNRRDRNSFVRIITENIAAGAESNFKMVDKHLIDHLGVRYDTKSVMHYGRYTFSKQRGLPTIESLDPDDPTLGGNELSPTDIERLNKYYCADQATTTITTTTTTTTPKTTTTKSTTTTPKTTTTTTTKSITTTPKTTTTTTESTTTTMESTTTTTPKTTTTTTPETTTTKSTTTSTTSIPGGCSDEILLCVLVHKSSVSYRESLCDKTLSTYADTCPYACGTCSPSNAEERCKHFTDDDQSTAQALNTRAKIEERVPGTGAASCEDLAKQGRCQSPSIGYNVRILCSRSCCMEGQLYTLRKSSYVM